MNRSVEGVTSAGFAGVLALGSRACGDDEGTAEVTETEQVTETEES